MVRAFTAQKRRKMKM